MISFKKRFKSHHLLSHEALLRRLKPKYRYNENLQANYHSYRAGYLGEKSVDYKLSLFPKKDFFHLPSLRLQNNFHFFQIDSLVLTSKLIFQLESKNIKGTLQYNGMHKQLIQIDGDKKTSYKDPILQAEIQKRHLMQWLQKYGVKIPIETIVVSANPNSLIQNPHNDLTFNDRFISLENLIFRMDEIYHSYHEHLLTLRQLKNLYHLLVQHDMPLSSDPIKYYNLKKHHFIQGVACERCFYSPLKRGRGYWTCPKCAEKNLLGHERVILDYFLIHRPFITNNICRELLQIASPDTSYYILNSMGLEKTGGNKNRKYLAPNLDQFPQDAEPKLFELSILDG